MVLTQMTATTESKCQLFVVYRGDIAQKLKDSGTLCPYRVNDKGNTEQIVEMFKGGDLIREDDEMRDLAETMILADCDKMGKVIHYAWQWVECSNPEKSDA